MVALLHAVADGEGLLRLWAESAEASGTEAGKPGGRKRRESAPPHPFQLPPPALEAALAELGIVVGKGEAALLWLPGLEGRPLASAPLIAPLPAGADAAVLAPWRVATLPLPPAAAVDLLCRAAEDRRLAEGLFAAPDLLYWLALLRLAGSLTARRRLLPSLRRLGPGAAKGAGGGGERAEARWRPLLLGRDATHLARLAAALPPVARCLGEAAAPPERSAAALVAAVLERFADALARAAAPPPPTAQESSLDERWLNALFRPDPGLRGTGAELEALEQRLARWQRPLALAAESPVRLCFRLEEPPLPEDDEEGEEAGPAVAAQAPWTLRYLLQSQADPSLLLPVEEAWSPGARGAALLGESRRVREYLLQSLARAGRLWPAIAEGLDRGATEGVETDASGAVAFLTQAAPALEEAGFGVLLPAWWSGRGTRARLATRAKVRSGANPSSGAMALEQVLKFDWEVALGDRSLSRAELQELARLKTPLVRLRGQWVLLDAEEIRAAARRLQQRGEQATAGELLRMALGAADAPEAEAVETEGWLREVLERLTGERALEPLPPPKGLQAELRPYQARGYAWLDYLTGLGLGACLADDMGLGKTLQTLALIAHRRRARKGPRRPVLLVCPTSVMGGWQREAARFLPGLKLLLHHGPERAKEGKALTAACRGMDLVVTSYALLQRDAALLQARRWAGLVFDEAQNLKNPQSRQAQAARALEAEWRVALTGTPVENQVGDLWSLMQLLNPGFLGSQAQFRRRFVVPIHAEGDEAARESLRRLTRPFLLRRVKTDRAIISDLPDKLENRVFCPLTREQASLYAAVVEESLRRIESAEEGIERRGLVLATLARLKQVCNHPAHYLADGSALAGRSGKLERLEEMLEEVFAGGERALVFTQFGEMGELLRRRLEERFGLAVPFLHGGLAKAERDRQVEAFQAGEGAPVFLLTVKAGGTGLTLTAASHVFHYDRWWNPAVENQATDRAYRIGQTRRVEVHKFLCGGTLEERIDDLIESKRALAESIVGGGEDWLTGLDGAELRALLSLRDAALA